MLPLLPSVQLPFCFPTIATFSIAIVREKERIACSILLPMSPCQPEPHKNDIMPDTVNRNMLQFSLRKSAKHAWPVYLPPHFPPWWKISIKMMSLSLQFNIFCFGFFFTYLVFWFNISVRLDELDNYSQVPQAFATICFIVPYTSLLQWCFVLNA